MDTPSGDRFSPYSHWYHCSTDETMISVSLLDTGASVNVLPYELGVQLGAIGENQTVSIPLSGNLSSSTARGVVLSGIVANFAPVDLAFAILTTKRTSPLPP